MHRRHTFPLPALPLLAALVAWAICPQQAAARQESWGSPWLAARPPRQQRTSISNQTIPEVLRELATRDKQVLLAVVHFNDIRSMALDMAKNWALSLQAHDLLRHTLIVVPDQQSLEIAHAVGLPALLDEAFPTDAGPWKMQRQWIITNRIYDVSKHWWGMRVVEHGYSVLYMDVDMVLLRDPLPYLRAAPYDVQGLSDYMTPDLMPVGSVLDKPCDFYKLVLEGQSPTGSQMREAWNLRGDDHKTQLQVLNPCQSTGFWHIKPTKPGVTFMKAMVDRLFTLPWGWDQTVWQEVIMAHLVGMGDDPPVRFRILPVDKFANDGVLKDRLSQGLPVDLHMLHMGAVIGFNHKICEFAQLNLWHPERWTGDLPSANTSVYTGEAVCGKHRVASLANLTFPSRPPHRVVRMLTVANGLGGLMRSMLSGPGATLLALGVPLVAVAVGAAAWRRNWSWEEKRRRSG